MQDEAVQCSCVPVYCSPYRGVGSGEGPGYSVNIILYSKNNMYLSVESLFTVITGQQCRDLFSGLLPPRHYRLQLGEPLSAPPPAAPRSPPYPRLSGQGQGGQGGVRGGVKLKEGSLLPPAHHRQLDHHILPGNGDLGSQPAARPCKRGYVARAGHKAVVMTLPGAVLADPAMLPQPHWTAV